MQHQTREQSCQITTAKDSGCEFLEPAPCECMSDGLPLKEIEEQQDARHDNICATEHVNLSCDRHFDDDAAQCSVLSIADKDRNEIKEPSAVLVGSGNGNCNVGLGLLLEQDRQTGTTTIVGLVEGFAGDKSGQLMVGDVLR